jgi:hypothetical protein
MTEALRNSTAVGASGDRGGRAYEFRVMNWVVASLSSTLLALVGDVNFPHRNKRQAGMFLLSWAG